MAENAYAPSQSAQASPDATGRHRAARASEPAPQYEPVAPYGPVDGPYSTEPYGSVDPYGSTAQFQPAVDPYEPVDGPYSADRYQPADHYEPAMHFEPADHFEPAAHFEPVVQPEPAARFEPVVQPEPAGRTEQVVRREPARRRRRHLWLLPVVALGAGLLLVLALPLLPGDDRRTPPQQPQNRAAPQVGVPATAPTDVSWLPWPSAAASTAPPGSAAPTSAAPSVAPDASALPSQPPVAITPTTPPADKPPVAAPPAQPTLLGPNNGDVSDMVGGYCRRHVTGQDWVGTSGGRWVCQRLLLSGLVVDMDAACRDRFGSGAFAQTSNVGDPNAWRCFRR